MVKNYEIPEEEPQMVRESAVAYAYSNIHETDIEKNWNDADAPCQYTSEVLRSVILQSLDDKKNGRVHTHADVQRMINSRIEAWR